MVFEKLRQMIAKELNVPESKITMDTHFVDDLGADSLDAIEIVMAIESEFGISVSDEEAQTIQRVSDIVKIIESKK